MFKNICVRVVSAFDFELSIFSGRFSFYTQAAVGAGTGLILTLAFFEYGSR